MHSNWNWRKFVPFIAIIAAVIFILSGFMAHRMAPIDTQAVPDANGFSSAILVTIFITIPAFVILCVAVAALVIDAVNKRRE